MSTEKRILILGASGYIGRCIFRQLSPKYTHVFGTYCTNHAQYSQHPRMLRAVLEEGQLPQVLEAMQPDVIISMASTL